MGTFEFYEHIYYLFMKLSIKEKLGQGNEARGYQLSMMGLAVLIGVLPTKMLSRRFGKRNHPALLL